MGNPVISFLFRLQYADPQELQQVLMAYLQGSSGTINILALPKSSSLLVTQNADIIRQLASVIEQVDVAPAEVVSEFIKLDRADATKVTDMLKEIFEKGGRATEPTGGDSQRESALRPCRNRCRLEPRVTYRGCYRRKRWSWARSNLLPTSVPTAFML